MKKTVLILVLILFSLGIGKGVYFLKDGFSFRRIHTLNQSQSLGWSSEVDQALQQTYHYLGRGRQCFAFASSDGKYVLKFPRTDIYCTPFWARVLPVKKYRDQLASAHKKREAFIRKSFELSFYDLKNETGLIAVHLGTTCKNNKTLKLVDASGSSHNLPLYKTSFVLQYKHPLLMQKYTDALKNNDRTTTKKILDSLINVITVRAKRGILNRDRSFLRNYGFDGERAYQIDIGSFFCDPNLEKQVVFQKSIRDSIDPVQEWLQENDPEMLTYVNQQLHKILYAK